MTLNLARSGAKLVVAASLHGEYPHLDTKVGTNGATGTYNTEHFVEMVGLADPFIPEKSRNAWVSELQGYTANTDKTFDFIVYGTAVHAFSIEYSENFLNVLAFVLRKFKGQDGAKRVGNGIPGVIRYDPDVSATSFETIDKLLVQYQLVEAPKEPVRQSVKLVEKEVKYSDGAGGELVGYSICEETTSKAKRPGLLVFPGPYGDGGGKHERDVAREYARKGLVVFLPDYYPTRNSDTDFNQTLAAVAAYEPFLEDSAKAQAIAKLGYDQLAKMATVDPDKISAIGFCFGGAMTLNLARSGAKLVVAASLHGEYPHLDTKVGTNGATGTYNTEHFVEMVGLADPFIPEKSRNAWVSELQGYTANTDKTFDFIVYGTAVHAFSIEYSENFLNVLAFVLRKFKGQDGAKRVGNGIPGVIRYDPDVSAMSFTRTDDVFTQVGMFSEPSGGSSPTKKPGPPTKKTTTKKPGPVTTKKAGPVITKKPGGGSSGPASGLVIMADNACIKLGVKSDVEICRVGPNELAVSGDLKVNGVSLKAFMEKADKFMKGYKK